MRKVLSAVRHLAQSPLTYWITIGPIATEWSLSPYVQSLRLNSACHDPLHIDCEVGFSHCVTVFILCGPRFGHIRSRSQVICGRQRFRENWGRAVGPNKIRNACLWALRIMLCYLSLWLRWLSSWGLRPVIYLLCFCQYLAPLALSFSVKAADSASTCASSSGVAKAWR